MQYLRGFFYRRHSLHRHSSHMISSRLILALSILCLRSIEAAGQRNVTIDDEVGDEVTQVVPSFMPLGGWTSRGGTKGFAKPDPSLAYNTPETPRKLSTSTSLVSLCTCTALSRTLLLADSSAPPPITISSSTENLSGSTFMMHKDSGLFPRHIGVCQHNHGE
ncbi:hypothetical protein BDN71DRAFT_634830 [Pleurotus eryngii]|uniref:Secreted protein n=1 Tax=Pleurotus eryngii TaxID=5323 RepID=A0A9P6DA52_PLEER|nr:hypothetical protein BDN71DRAFT_634830 [Pleurotus eryngii]